MEVGVGVYVKLLYVCVWVCVVVMVVCGGYNILGDHWIVEGLAANVACKGQLVLVVVAGCLDLKVLCGNGTAMHVRERAILTFAMATTW